MFLGLKINLPGLRGSEEGLTKEELRSILAERTGDHILTVL